jgi:hypothetical protein
MKKLFTILFALLLVTNFINIQAQTHFSLGLRSGTNFSNLSFNPDIPSQISKSSRTGILFGAAAELSFIPMLSLQIEPTYITGGAELSGPLFTNGFQSISGKITYKETSLVVPILIKVKIPVKGLLTPYAFAGPNIVFLMSSKELDEPNGYSSNEIDQKDFTTSVGFALDFGAGASYKVSPEVSISLDVRYSLGLTNMLNDKGKQSLGNDQSIKPNGFQVAVGAMFNL